MNDWVSSSKILESVFFRLNVKCKPSCQFHLIQNMKSKNNNRSDTHTDTHKKTKSNPKKKKIKYRKLNLEKICWKKTSNV